RGAAGPRPLGGRGGAGAWGCPPRRDLGWQRYGLVPLRLGVLDSAAATDLLVGLTGDQDRATAGALAADLGYLPLALDQAGAYVSEHRTTLAGYRQLLAPDPGRALTPPPERARGRPGRRPRLEPDPYRHRRA